MQSLARCGNKPRVFGHAQQAMCPMQGASLFSTATQSSHQKAATASNEPQPWLSTLGKDCLIAEGALLMDLINLCFLPHAATSALTTMHHHGGGSGES